MGKKKGAKPSVDRAEQKAALFEDRVVRLAFAGLAAELRTATSEHMKRMRPRVAEIAEALPASVTADEAAAMLQLFARECSSREIEGRGRGRTSALHAIAVLLDRMSATGYESRDPCIAWIREHRAALDLCSGLRRRRAIAKVASSELGAALCRMARAGSDGQQAAFVCFDTTDRVVQDLILDTVEAHSAKNLQGACTALGRVAPTFAASLGGSVPDIPSGFGEGHLERQLRYYRGHEKVEWLLVRTYLGIARAQGPEGVLAAAGITVAFLESPNFISSFLDGYRAVSYSPLDQPPDWDRWFVFPNGTEDDFAEGKPNVGLRVDFQRIDEPLRKHAKRWFWEGTESLLCRCKRLEVLARFCEWRKDNATVAVPGSTYLMLSDEIDLYLSSLRKTLSEGSCLATRTALRSFANSLSEEGDGLVDPLCLHPLASSGARGQGGVREKLTMPNEHREKVRSEFEKHSGDSLRDLLHHTAFLLLELTPLRVSSVFDLELSDIVETARSGLYAVRQPSKTTGRDVRSHLLPPEAKRAVGRAVQATQGLRDSAPEEMRDYVFLIPGARGSVATLKRPAFATRLASVCDKLKLPHYTPASVRSLYMTDVNTAADELGMGWPAERAASGHAKPETGPLHYIAHSDKEYYEAMVGVEIGTAKIRGILSPERPEGLGDADTVANGTGWCACPSCAKVVATCLMCPSFRTSPSQIPAFKTAIEETDTAIAELETDHDRGHMTAFKSLAATYLCALEGMRREMEGGVAS